MVRFSGQDRSRSFGCWIEDRRGGAESGEHVAGHHLSVGVEVGDHHMALREGSGELHPALLKYGIVGIVPAVFRVEIPTAALHGAELHGADGIIQRTEGLARPVIEPARGIVEALPCGEVLIADAGGGGKAVEAAAVAHQKLRGLGNGEDQQPAVLRRAVGEKAGDEVGEFVGGELLVPRHKIILAKLQRVDDVAGKEVGHLLHALAAALRLLQIAADLGRAAHAGDLHLHAALLSHGAVEFLHQKVHGRACLLAVNVPEGQGDRLLFIQQRFFPAAGESKNKGAEQQKREKALFHKEPSKTELVFAKERVIFEIS